ncbi:Uncharacterised protein [uncultured archaeon]|nr:Uncharacterised protein [uncultured archaeon]
MFELKAQNAAGAVYVLSQYDSFAQQHFARAKSEHPALTLDVAFAEGSAKFAVNETRCRTEAGKSLSATVRIDGKRAEALYDAYARSTPAQFLPTSIGSIVEEILENGDACASDAGALAEMRHLRELVGNKFGPFEGALTTVKRCD